MGLAPYEPSPEPERIVSKLDIYDRDNASFRSSQPPASLRARSARSREDAVGDASGFRPRGQSKSAGRSPPIFSDTAGSAPPAQQSDKGGGGLLGRLPTLGGAKSRAPPGPPPDTRRRKYNKSFGKKTGIPERQEDEDDYPEIEDVDDEPHIARAKSAAALKSGRMGAAGVYNGTPAERLRNEVQSRQSQEVTDSAEEDALIDDEYDAEDGDDDEEEDDDDDEGLPSYEEGQGMAAGASIKRERLLATHRLNGKAAATPAEDDDGLETSSDASDVPSAIQGRATGKNAPTAEDPSPAARKSIVAAAAAGAGASAASRRPRKQEPSDVADTEAPSNIVNSSTLVPGLTGGYLDENVPSLGLNEPEEASTRARKPSKSNGQVLAADKTTRQSSTAPARASKNGGPIKAPGYLDVEGAEDSSRRSMTSSRKAGAAAPIAAAAVVANKESSLRSVDARRAQTPRQVDDSSDDLDASSRTRQRQSRSVTATGYPDEKAGDTKKSRPNQTEDKKARREALAGTGLAAATAKKPSTKKAPIEENRATSESEDELSQGDGLDREIEESEEEAQDQQKGRGGYKAAAAGGATAALAGTAALSSRNDKDARGTNRSQASKERQLVAEEDDPELSEGDFSAGEEEDEDYDYDRPASRGDARTLIAEEKKFRKDPTKLGMRRQDEPVRAGQRKRSDLVGPLTPVQRHYLLKALVSLQMEVEWSELEKLGALTQYGYPFSLERPKLKRVKNKNVELEGDLAKGDFADMADDPYGEVDDDEARKLEGLTEPLILRHMFHAHLKAFPGLDTAPLKYWQKRIQPFFDEMAARNFSTSIERCETTTRHFFTLAMTRYLGGFFSRGFGVRGEGELRGPGKGVPGSDRWGKGKEWGKGTVKRGLDRPSRPDAQLMDRVDALFEGGEGDLWKRARKETKRIQGDWRAFKEFNIERETGLEETMQFLDIGNLKNLPPYYRNAEEYVRHFAAYMLHFLFVTSPAADGFYNILRGIHTLFPYWGAKQLLKVANAQTMIQGILNLVLARPAGAKSLLQRIFVSIIGGQASSIHKEYCVPLAKSIKDDELCKKLDDYVRRGNRPESKAIRSRAVRTGQDVLATILLYASGPRLSQSKKNEVLDLSEAFAHSPYVGLLDAAYPDKTPIAKEKRIPVVDNWGVDTEEAEMALKYARLKLYLREILKRRDRDQTCQMASGSLLPSIIKDSLDTVFYGPIKKVAEHSDLSSRLGDLQDFFDDMLRLRKTGQNALQDWIALAARHENSLYFLFHECAPIIQPFTEWLQNGADYMALSTTDPSHPANRKAKNVEVNLEEMLRDATLTNDDVQDMLEEINELEEYIKWEKVRYELEMRKNFLLSTGEAIPPSGLCADNIPKSSDFRQRIEDVDGLLSDLMEQEGVEMEDGFNRSDARGTEARVFPWAWFDAVDPLHQHIEGADPEDLSYVPSRVSPKVPALVATRKGLEPFRAVLRECLPAWREGSSNGVAPPGQQRVQFGSLNSTSKLGQYHNDRKSMSKSRDNFSVQGDGSNSKSRMSMPRFKMPLFGKN